MKRTTNRLTFALVTVGLAAVSASLAFAQTTKDPAKRPAPPAAPTPAAQGEQTPQLPPGWTEKDMQACIEAGTPGEQHKHLTSAAGTWTGKNTMWMYPGAEPTVSEVTSTVTPMMDGRFTKVEMTGEMPGMGPFNGFGIYGYDNVEQQFVSSWISNCGTGIMNGTGELSSDGKVLSWKFTHTCPMTKKTQTMREIETWRDKDNYTLEIHGADPKSGKEFKMMEIVFARKAGSTAPGRASATPRGH